VLLSGPFTQQIHDAGRWRSWVAGLGGEPVRLVWVRSDAATLRQRLTSRGSGRDTAKLADFTAFTTRMRLDDPPAAPHDIIDNRLTAASTLEDQVAALTARWEAAARLPQGPAFRESLFREPLFPEQTADDTDAGWGEYPETSDDRLYRDRPPHWDDF
jgi:hypothetical protein